MMNRDATIVQVAILLIIIAILGIAILSKQSSPSATTTSQQEFALIKEADKAQDPEVVVELEVPEKNGTVEVLVSTGINTAPQKVTEIINSDNANLVKQYFRAIAEQDYRGACSYLSSNKCNAQKEGAVTNFTREFEKMVDGYEYVSIKDYGFSAPSGKDVVCVKYSYSYKDDPQPGLISEVMSFYLNTTADGELKITDRVCEKKYKDGRGLRDCPIQANAEFCKGWVK